jgi:hypothetical protein
MTSHVATLQSAALLALLDELGSFNYDGAHRLPSEDIPGWQADYLVRIKAALEKLPPEQRPPAVIAGIENGTLARCDSEQFSEAAREWLGLTNHDAGAHSTGEITPSH